MSRNSGKAQAQRQHPQHFSLTAVFAVVAGLLASDCSVPNGLCSPVTGRVGFFSQGDCIYSRSSFFQGHEWLTFFGNDSLPEDQRFASAEVRRIANGNRRVDWPSEMLVHLDNGIIAYRDAMLRFTDLEENQPVHFLLGEFNSEQEAISASREVLYESTRDALEAWVVNRDRALALLGRANHTLQDSFSNAHSVRNEAHTDFGTPECKGRCGCIERIKAYRPRGKNKRAGILFHGGRANLDFDEEPSDDIGHTTPEDSIYEVDRECRNPSGQRAVRKCLRTTALAAVVATSSYFALIRAQVRLGNTGSSLDETVLRQGFDSFSKDHFTPCDELGD